MNTTTQELERLRAKVHPPQDIASIVRAELERQRQAEAARRREADEARFAGRCDWCGCTESVVTDEQGNELPDWHRVHGDSVCGFCAVDWSNGGDVDLLLDRVAWVLEHEGLDAFSIRRRSGWRWEPGRGRELGLALHKDSNHLPGAPWAHLAAVRLPEVVESGPTFGEALNVLQDRETMRRVHELRERRSVLIEALGSTAPPKPLPAGVRIVSGNDNTRPSRYDAIHNEITFIEKELERIGAEL